MKNKKGFTLIELLAVIVILAVIALIATPIILNMIEDAKKSSAKDSAYGYIKAIEYETSLADLKGTKYEDKEDYTYNEIKVNIKGEAPTGGRYSLKNGVVTSGVFCINGYTVNYENSIVTVGDKGCTGEDLKYEGKVVLSSTQGDYTYPESGTFEITENLSGGELSCTTSDKEVATCSIEGNIVTIKPGTKEDSATITIKSASTEKYKEAQAAYVVKTSKGTIPSINVEGYDGEEDGENHGITISTTIEGATIKYGESNGSYNLTSSPTYSDVGEYTVYYEITKEGYTTITGSKKVIIKKETVIAPTRSSTTSNSNSITAVYNTGSTTSGIVSTICYITDSRGNILSNGTLSGNNCVFSGLSSNTTYYYKKCITSKAGNTSCSGVSNILTAGKVTNIDYTGGEQNYTTTCTGSFKIELWGASGGNGSGIQNKSGGKGAYVLGIINTNKNYKFYINIGGKGYDAPEGTYGEKYDNVKGGYNGGASTTGLNQCWGAGGGGATHLALESGLLKDISKENVLLVAAGGGGSSIEKDRTYIWEGNGGSAGGLNGYPGTTDGNTQCIANIGASQISGGSSTCEYFGYFGYSQNGYDGGGGGGGYYGGGSGVCSGGSGGSSYINGHDGCSSSNTLYKFYDTLMIDGNGYKWTTTKGDYIGMPTHDGNSNMSGNVGNGYARITILSCTN